jgi:hypothetical protein
MEVANHVKKIFLKIRLTKRACHVRLREPTLNARALLNFGCVCITSFISVTSLHSLIRNAIDGKLETVATTPLDLTFLNQALERPAITGYNNYEMSKIIKTSLLDNLNTLKICN